MAAIHGVFGMARTSNAGELDGELNGRPAYVAIRGQADFEFARALALIEHYPRPAALALVVMQYDACGFLACHHGFRNEGRTKQDERRLS